MNSTMNLKNVAIALALILAALFSWQTRWQRRRSGPGR